MSHIQSHMLHCVMAVLEMLPSTDGYVAHIYSGVADDIKAASDFFRFSMAGGSLPSDAVYIDTVKSLLQFGQPLTRFVSMLRDRYLAFQG